MNGVLVLVILLISSWPIVVAIPPLPPSFSSAATPNDPQEVARQMKILFEASQQIARYAAKNGVSMAGPLGAVAAAASGGAGGGILAPSLLLQNLFTAENQKQVMDLVENAASQDDMAKEVFQNYKKFTQRMRTDVVPHLNQIVTGGRPRGNPAIEYAVAGATLFAINVHMAQEYVRHWKKSSSKSWSSSSSSQCERHQQALAIALIHSSAVDGIYRLGKALLKRTAGINVGTHLDGRVLFVGSTMLTLGAIEALLWNPDLMCDRRHRRRGTAWNKSPLLTLPSPPPAFQRTVDRHLSQPLRELDRHVARPLRSMHQQLSRAGQEASQQLGSVVYDVAVTSQRQANVMQSLVCYQVGRFCRWVERRK